MQPFVRLTAVTAPLLRANIDTDAIIPSREMKTVSKTGLADGLFAGWRYRQIGGREVNPDFVLNQAAYAGTQALLGGDNFGCGSSREHAVWALAEYGIRAIIAPSFAPIFFSNCVRNGILPVRLSAEDVAAIAAWVECDPQHHRVSFDLPAQTVVADGQAYHFELASEPKEMLLEGLDAIDLTLKHASAITAFQQADRARRPWIYDIGGR
ncbi:MAG: 3-isopropylmalate dehydratase small subunit [Steroidobacteraceae bacterium]